MKNFVIKKVYQAGEWVWAKVSSNAGKIAPDVVKSGGTPPANVTKTIGDRTLKSLQKQGKQGQNVGNKPQGMSKAEWNRKRVGGLQKQEKSLRKREETLQEKKGKAWRKNPDGTDKTATEIEKILWDEDSPTKRDLSIYKSGGQVYRGRKYASGGRVAKYKG
jgi:hypothetical protein